MNKFTKGAIATGAAVVLLMGGAGTLAYWNDSADVLGAGQAIASGNLDVNALATPTAAWNVKPWNGTTSGTAVSIPDISTFKMVPGDVVEYTKSIEVIVTGQTLKAQLSLASGSITSTPNALSGLLTKKIEIVGTVAGVTETSVGSGIYNLPAGTTTIPVKVTVTWPNGTTVADNAAKLQSVTFGAFAVNVTQVFS